MHVPPLSYCTGVRNEVHLAILKYGLVALTIDGWEDYAKMPTLAFTIHIPDGRALLFKFHRVESRETGEYLKECTMEVVEEIRSLGGLVQGIHSDGGLRLMVFCKVFGSIIFSLHIFLGGFPFLSL